MKWLKPLYADDKAAAHGKEIVNCLETGTLTAGSALCYALILSTTKSGSLDIIPCYAFKSSWYRKNNVTVIGISGSKDGAKDIVLRIMQETLDRTGTADIKAYFAAFPPEKFTERGEVSLP